MTSPFKKSHVIDRGYPCAATEAPTPWRVVKSPPGIAGPLSECAAVLDAFNRTLFITVSHDIAERVVTAVNQYDPGGKDPFNE